MKVGYQFFFLLKVTIQKNLNILYSIFKYMIVKNNYSIFVG